MHAEMAPARPPAAPARRGETRGRGRPAGEDALRMGDGSREHVGVLKDSDMFT